MPPPADLASISLARLPLGDFPTRVECLDGLVSGRRIWCKREDLASPLYGGNKVRKLEWILPRVIERGGDLLTLGAAGSNYLVACALHGREHGVGLHALLTPRPDAPEARDNARIVAALARSTWACRSYAALPFVARRAFKAAGRPAVQPPGGSSPLGCVGWVEGALEIASQVRRGELPEPDEVFVPLGSGGTTAGLLVGLGMSGLGSRLHAVRVTPLHMTNRAFVLALARSTTSLLRRSGIDLPPVDRRRLVVHSDFLGVGYGHPTPECLEARVLARERAGIALEPTYSAKAFAAVLRAAREGGAGTEILFIDTWSSSSLEAHLRGLPLELPPELEPLLTGGDG